MILQGILSLAKKIFTFYNYLCQCKVIYSHSKLLFENNLSNFICESKQTMLFLTEAFATYIRQLPKIHLYTFYYVKIICFFQYRLDVIATMTHFRQLRVFPFFFSQKLVILAYF